MDNSNSKRPYTIKCSHVLTLASALFMLLPTNSEAQDVSYFTDLILQNSVIRIEVRDEYHFARVIDIETEENQKEDLPAKITVKLCKNGEIIEMDVPEKIAKVQFNCENSTLEDTYRSPGSLALLDSLVTVEKLRSATLVSTVGDKFDSIFPIAEVWEDPYGRLHLIVDYGNDGHRTLIDLNDPNTIVTINESGDVVILNQY